MASNERDLLDEENRHSPFLRTCLVGLGILFGSLYMGLAAAMLLTDPNPTMPPSSSSSISPPLPLSDEPQILTLQLRPVISGSGSPTDDKLPYGPFYDSDVFPPYTEFTMQALKISGDSDKVAAVQVATEWMITHAREIYRTIFLLDYDTHLKKSVRFHSLEILQDHVHIRLQERQPQSATYEIREELRHNVHVGADTWECGDFGDVPMGKNGQMLRVSLSQFKPEWIPPLLSPPPPPPE